MATKETEEASGGGRQRDAATTEADSAYAGLCGLRTRDEFRKPEAEIRIGARTARDPAHLLDLRPRIVFTRVPF
jgi:hypothetical protein